MAIKFKNSQLNNDTIRVINYIMEIEINGDIAFKLMKIIKELNYTFDDRLKMEQKILDKWIEKDEEGKPVPVKDEEGNVLTDVVNLKDAESFNKEMSSLMQIEHELPFDKVKFSEIGLEKIKIKDLLSIEFLFE